jgi:hypothetical protein
MGRRIPVLPDFAWDAIMEILLKRRGDARLGSETSGP